MANSRRKYSEAQQTALISQVDQICPLCEEPLFYKKSGRSYKNYEIAHIYPLNARPDEQTLLANEERLSEDLNDENNVIPLCQSCHGKFDKPRTAEEYRSLVALKKRIIAKSSQQEIWKRHAIEAEINHVIDAIFHGPELEIDAEIEFFPKKVDEKLNSSMTRPTHRKIKNNVQDYYVYIREKFAALDQTGECISETISLQIKTFYLIQKRAGFPQQVAFENIVDWLYAKTKPETKDAAEIIASFFVQNCEVFE